MRGATILFWAAVFGCGVGCASAGLPELELHPAQVFSDGERVDTFDLGGSGEVFIRPRLLVTGFDSFPLVQDELRLQVSLRIALKNGGTIAWALGADGDAPRSEGGRRWRPSSRDGLKGVELGGARLGPIAVEQIEALEVLAGWLRAPMREQARAQGVRALGAAPTVGATPDRWAAAGRQVSSLGAAPLLVARIPLSKERARAPGEHRVRLAIVAPGNADLQLHELGFSAPVGEAALPWPDGLATSDLCLVVLDVNLQVQPSVP